eukprot:TRINITY_DN9303_c0_g1_i1.p1 TRINITY_DN9303_c0_g1~~TRINITY_DN9303_c0_g1_i1.p1  ORF type:complete len:334 (-),score=26.45 TRINITY_DN9303_c0_g1_i1:65-982(-)
MLTGLLLILRPHHVLVNIDKSNLMRLSILASDVMLPTHDELPVCEFDSVPAAFPAWTGEQSKWHERFLEQLHNASVVTSLTAGSLLGAYRHHGVIPFDLDMDVTFNVCDNIGLVRRSSSRFATLSCEEINSTKAQIQEKKFAQEFWDDVLRPVLGDQHITMVGLSPGGIRLSNGGAKWDGWPNGTGVDFSLTVEPLSTHVANWDLCKCTFGNTFAYCRTDSERVLIQQYGTNFMVPKSQCDFYNDMGHPNWAFPSKPYCDWAKDAVSRAATAKNDFGEIANSTYASRFSPVKAIGFLSQVFSFQR